MVTPQAEVDPNKNPNTTSVAGTESGKMLIRLTQRRSTGAGLSAARYLGVQVIGAGPATRAVGDQRRGDERQIDNSGALPMASVTTSNGFRNGGSARLSRAIRVAGCIAVPVIPARQQSARRMCLYSPRLG
jgi:hypothetical protein